MRPGEGPVATGKRDKGGAKGGWRGVIPEQTALSKISAHRLLGNSTAEVSNLDRPFTRARKQAVVILELLAIYCESFHDKHAREALVV
ncbi:hypothetical protein ACLOJK_030964 [Asimina triloba]